MVSRMIVVVATRVKVGVLLEEISISSGEKNLVGRNSLFSS